MESIINEFIKLKKEEFNYLDSIAKISSKKVLTEKEKLEIYRKDNDYQVRLGELIEKLGSEIRKSKKISNGELDFRDVIIDIDVDKNFLDSIDFEKICTTSKERFLKTLGINPQTYKFKLSVHDVLEGWYYKFYDYFEFYIIQNCQELTEKPIYVFSHYIDYSDDVGFPNPNRDYDDYFDAVYEDIFSKPRYEYKTPKKNMTAFEKDKTIIYSKGNVYSDEVKKIFKEELLNTNNKTVDDSVEATRKKVKELAYLRSPEYKEKLLLERINELYKKVKGEYIKEEILYRGDFLDIIKETYKLPNEKIVEKEKVVKNKGKDSVIIVALDENKNYIITFQNRIKDKISAEFASGYIEDGETPIDAAKRELKEETGYISNDLFMVDDAYTSLGIDNSITYIVVARNCIKTDEIKTNGSELVSHGLFSKSELKYLIDNNLMIGSTNKLAYYNLINNTRDGCFYNGDNKKYKKTK